MTREEAIKELERTFDVLDHYCHMDNRRKEAFNMARVALFAEPCEKTQMIDKSNFDPEQYRADLQCAFDCGKASVECEDAISRQAVIDAIADTNVNGESLGYRLAEEIVSEIPSVTPKQKMGHWVPTDKAWAGINKCSICGYRKDAHHKMDFCPSCGAKMAESEDKK